MTTTANISLLETRMSRIETQLKGMIHAALERLDENMVHAWIGFRDALVQDQCFDKCRNNLDFKLSLLITCELIESLLNRTQIIGIADYFADDQQIDITEMLIKCANQLVDRGEKWDYEDEIFLIIGFLQMIREGQKSLRTLSEIESKAK